MPNAVSFFPELRKKELITTYTLYYSFKLANTNNLVGITYTATAISNIIVIATNIPVISFGYTWRYILADNIFAINFCHNSISHKFSSRKACKDQKAYNDCAGRIPDNTIKTIYRLLLLKR